MDEVMDYYPLLSYELMDYYEKVSKGLIEERPYDYWGPETAEERAHWNRWWLPIQESFYPVDWDSGFTGRGIAKGEKKALERPGLIGPMDEMFVMDVDPMSGKILYRVESRTSFGSGVARRVKEKRRKSVEAASKICKRVKEQFVPFGELRQMTRGLRASWSDTGTVDLMASNDTHHL